MKPKPTWNIKKKDDDASNSTIKGVKDNGNVKKQNTARTVTINRTGTRGD